MQGDTFHSTKTQRFFLTAFSWLRFQIKRGHGQLFRVCGVSGGFMHVSGWDRKEQSVG